MTSLYGHKWVAAYGDEPDPDGVWQATLDGIDWEGIRKAMGELAKRGDEWPPSAPEFRKLCTGQAEHWAHRVMAEKDRNSEKPKRLSASLSEEQRKKASETISNLRKSLKSTK